MKKLLNTLYITRQNSYLHKERETVIVKCGDEKLAQFPIQSLVGIFCFGRVSVSPFLMEHCAQTGVGLAFYTEHGRFLARVQGRETGNVLLRRTQYRWADDTERTVQISRLIVAAKIANSRSVVLREIRNHGNDTALSDVASNLASSLQKVRKAVSLDEIRGVEGAAASSYFSIFNKFIRVYGFNFEGRVRRPPTDPVNALLSFVYSLITQECVSALQGIGLDPYVGFLHRDRPGRPSLALDLLEEFRSSWADRFVLTIINRQQIKPNDFIKESSGAVRLQENARKKVLKYYQERKQKEVIHPYIKEKLSIGLLPHSQALLLSRHLRGDLEYYTPYLVK